ncbi:hypothetical protein PF008_g6053 [Phytophthora fragariae]|uniref:Retrotransposon gag domain-containing protein n=1 Tax=Phytophthora fragariae TaxID=53985 RepID=A0A6G0S6I5_9STRA|nr:hypothetical protein PF008_g6053 [Phytophthora fragariae]
MSDHPDRSQPITDIGPGDLGGGDKENNIPSNNLQGGDEQRVVHPVSNIPDPTQLQAQAQLQQQEPHGQVQQELQRQQIQDLVQQELQRQQQRLMQPTGTSSTSYRPQAEPNFGRVIKTFKIESFDGSVEQGAIDSGVATWFTRFEALLEMQEDLHQVRLPERMKNSLVFQHLSGAANQWYISNVLDLRSRTFSSLGRELKREFGSKLSKAQIGQLVANEKKKNAETYREYSLRLRAMAAATSSDGFETEDSNNLALSSFIVNAWRKHTDNLRMVIREDSSHPVRELDRAISRLCSIAGHQGVLSSPPRQSAPTTKPLPLNKNGNSNLGKRKATEGEIKREGGFKKRDYSKMRCGTCGELGHTTGYHDRFVERKSSGVAYLASGSNDIQSTDRSDERGDKGSEASSFD